MKCQRCNEKDASVHLTKIINGEKTEVYLCEDCARESGQLPFAANNPFAFQNLLKGLMNPDVNSYEQYQQDIKCENCGMTYSEFSKKGLFGCAECYKAFDSKLEPLLKRIQGNRKHNGKVPKRRGGALRVRREIEELRDEMQKAVNDEDFEKAADIRDEIKELERKIDGGEKADVTEKGDK